MSCSRKHLWLHIVKLKNFQNRYSYKMWHLYFILIPIFLILLTSCARNSPDEFPQISAPEPANTGGFPIETGFNSEPIEPVISPTPTSSEQSDQSISEEEDSKEPAPATTTPNPSENIKQESNTGTQNSEPVPTPKATPAPAPTPIFSEGVVNPYVPYTYEQMLKESAELSEKYPDIITLDTIGNSVEGRDLLLIKLGKGDKKIILCGSHHAREYITSTYLMKMVEEYAKAYTDNSSFGDYDTKSLLDRVTIYVVPMVNPDGVNLVNNGLNTVTNKDDVQAMALVRPTYREWKANINGVDLNRQYPAHWEEKYDNVGRPASENFKGIDAATEPEVQAMMNLSEEHEFILAASFHTKGNSVFWADEGTVDQIPGANAIAKRLASLTKYQMLPVSKKPSVYGAGYENWFRLQFKRPAFCIELTPYNNTDVPHDDRKFDSLVWKNAKYIGLFLADEALKR